MKILARIIQDVFIISFITYVAYLGLELAFEGLISNYFDLNLLLLVVLLSGGFSIFSKERQNVL